MVLCVKMSEKHLCMHPLTKSFSVLISLVRWKEVHPTYKTHFNTPYYRGRGNWLTHVHSNGMCMCRH